MRRGGDGRAARGNLAFDVKVCARFNGTDHEVLLSARRSRSRGGGAVDGDDTVWVFFSIFAHHDVHPFLHFLPAAPLSPVIGFLLTAARATTPLGRGAKKPCHRYPRRS